MFQATSTIFVIIAFLFSTISFAHTSKPEIDFLFVIDNSGSMMTSQQHLAAEIPIFLNKLLNKNIDYRAAVTTTDAFISIFKNDFKLSEFKDGNSSDGPSGARVVTNKTPHAAEVLMRNLRQGIEGSGDERAFSSFEAALVNPLNSSFRRKNAHLSIIILSDEDDSSHNSLSFVEDYSQFSPVADSIDFLDRYTGSSPFYRLYTVSAFAIFDQECKTQLSNSGQKFGQRYNVIVEATNGSKVSLCSNFTSGLEQVLQATLNNMNH